MQAFSLVRCQLCVVRCKRRGTPSQSSAIDDGTRLTVSAHANSNAGQPATTNYMAIEYHIYSNRGVGDPIDYASPAATAATLTWSSSTLSYPGSWSLAVRAFDTVSGLEEANLDCAITIELDANGNDITNQPQPPAALRALAMAGGAIRVEWHYPPTTGPRTPSGFHIYVGDRRHPELHDARGNQQLRRADLEHVRRQLERTSSTARPTPSASGPLTRRPKKPTRTPSRSRLIRPGRQPLTRWPASQP